MEKELFPTKLEMLERDETRYDLFEINCKDDGGLDREEARRRVMARVEVNLIYPFFPAPPCPLQFRFIYHLILLLETFGIEAEHTELWLG